jgi:hypothetical protein
MLRDYTWGLYFGAILWGNTLGLYFGTVLQDYTSGLYLRLYFRGMLREYVSAVCFASMLYEGALGLKGSLEACHSRFFQTTLLALLHRHQVRSPC